MPSVRSQAMKLFSAMFVTAALLMASAAAAVPFRVATSITIRNGDWFPLPVEDMKAAASDAALAEISSQALLHIVSDEAEANDGTLGLDVSLIGKAGTAKLTITLSLKGQPTYVSTASISVRGLDHQELYRAFEHIGQESARRLSAKVEALVVHPRQHPASQTPIVPPSTPEGDAPALKATYNEAQRLKHERLYQESRVLFEQVLAAEGSGTARLHRLAADELRYGLPVFEAKQLIVGTGSTANGLGAKLELIPRVENLYRQIQAENGLSEIRIQEAQRALDDLAVMRVGLTNAMHQFARASVMNLRMLMMQQVAMTDDCPDEAAATAMLEELPSSLELQRYELASDGAVHYTILDAESGVANGLVCSHRGVDFEP